MARVFISHSSGDKVLAHAVAEKLEEWGYDPFLDFDSNQGIVGGTDWEAAIFGAIRESLAVLVCFTEAVTDSPWCFAETLIARYENKPVIPLLLRGTPDAIWGILQQTVQHIDLRQDPSQGYLRLRQSLDRLVPVSEQRVTDGLLTGSPPYAGLAPMTEKDSPYYFGRDRDVQSALARLRPKSWKATARVLTVTGASGSGKSSMVSAALLPSLRRGVVSGSNEWLYLVMQPSGHPARRLAEAARAVAPGIGTTREVVRQVEADIAGLSYLLSDVLADTAAPTACLVIDQLEEFVTIGEDQSDAFTEALSMAIEDLGHDRLAVISTVRVDMLGALLERFALSRHLLADPLILTRLEQQDLERVIVGPAAAAGWNLDGELVRRVVSDAATVADPLPLVSYVMRLMYDKALSPGRLTVQDYELTDGVAGALAANAESLVSHLSEAERDELATSLVETLVAYSDEGSVSRRRASRSEVASTALSGFETLVAGRLLVANVDDSGGPTFEIAHEALFRHWPRLRDAIEVAETDVRYARRILQIAHDRWDRRRALPRQGDVEFILDSINRLSATPSEIEVLVRACLAEHVADDFVASQLADDRGIGDELIKQILDDDDGSAQYGLLGYVFSDEVQPLIERNALAAKLLDSPIEAVRRAARRASGVLTDHAGFVSVEPGQYRVGDSCAPVHVVTDGFRVSKYLVTNLEFAEFVDATSATWPAHWPRGANSAVDAVRRIADYPVVHVSYFAAIAYCLFRSSEEHVVRLPTEPEWEIALLHGSPDGMMADFPWGDAFDSSLCNTSEAAMGQPTLIGKYSQFGGDSPLGIADLSGNVWEWTSSRGRALDGTVVVIGQGDDSWPDQAAEWGPRVQKGGTFLADSGFAKRAFRLVNLPDLSLQDFGFRVVHEVAGPRGDAVWMRA